LSLVGRSVALLIRDGALRVEVGTMRSRSALLVAYVVVVVVVILVTMIEVPVSYSRFHRHRGPRLVEHH
jgi:hypothetical protein